MPADGASPVDGEPPAPDGDSGAPGPAARPPAPDKPEPDRQHSALQLSVLTCAFVGVNVLWNYIILFATPFFISLGVSKPVVPLLWLGAPISGIVVQPWIGAFCDESTSRWGRRRPALVWSMILALASLAAMATSRAIWAVAAAFQLLNVAANGVEASCRGLVMDSISPEQQPAAWAYVGMASNVGTLLISVAGGIDFVSLAPGTMSQFQWMTALSGLFLVATAVVTVFAVKETPYRPLRRVPTFMAGESEPLLSLAPLPELSWGSHLQRSFVKAFRSLVLPVPPILSLINTASFWGWGAGSLVSMFGTAWVQLHAPDPDLGLRVASLSSVAGTLLATVCTLTVPPLVRRLRVPMKWAWVAGNLTGAALLAAGPAFAGDMFASAAVLASTGFYWMALVWVPMALLGEFVSARTARPGEEEVLDYDAEEGSIADVVDGASTKEPPEERVTAGGSIGVLNFYQSFPNLLTIALSTVIFGVADDGADTMAVVGTSLQVGGAMALISAFYAARIPNE
ncbi:major facilitator superfamily domain-containing protein [Hyaloraphidium curvatum]|nr:major facilitator superfamily domain-containing protein [Hyaloraphidium curvatum]